MQHKTILVTGASGFVGRSLCQHFSKYGYELRQLSRKVGAEFFWDPASGHLDQRVLNGVDVVVHLAGEPIAQRWTSAVKQRIMQSRVASTELLVRAMLAQAKPPALILASGINYYGYQVAETLQESSELGAGFLAEVCSAWEGAADPLRAAGARVCCVRTGVVLGTAGGALAKMLPAFRLGLGGPLGSGTQMMSWITLADLVRVYQFVTEEDALQGVLNAVSPAAVSNLAFTKALGSVIRRPTVLPMPSWLVRALFGTMADETLLADLTVQPKSLEAAGFQWRSSTIESALAAIFKAA
jgi:uncharacterized protein (TIGR01777 family)